MPAEVASAARVSAVAPSRIGVLSRKPLAIFLSAPVSAFTSRRARWVAGGRALPGVCLPDFPRCVTIPRVSKNLRTFSWVFSSGVSRALSSRSGAAGISIRARSEQLRYTLMGLESRSRSSTGFRPMRASRAAGASSRYSRARPRFRARSVLQSAPRSASVFVPGPRRRLRGTRASAGSGSCPQAARHSRAAAERTYSPAHA